MVMNPALDRQPPTITKECPQSFKELCETFNLKDSYRLLYNNLKTFSRRQGHRQSRLDRFYIDQGWPTYLRLGSTGKFLVNSRSTGNKVTSRKCHKMQ